MPNRFISTIVKHPVFCQNLKMTFQWSEKTDLSNITIFISRLNVRKITQQPSNITLWREQAWMKKSQEPKQQASSSLWQLLIHVVATPVVVSTRLDFRTSFRLTTLEVRQRKDIGFFERLWAPFRQANYYCMLNSFSTAFAQLFPFSYPAMIPPSTAISKTHTLKVPLYFFKKPWPIQVARVFSQLM